MSANNPLLQSYDLPPFSAIRAEHVLPAIEQILADNRSAIAAILKSQGENPTWEGLVLAMDELNDRLGAAWSPVSHLNAVCNSAELREAYESCLPALSAYATELGQNRELFQAYQALAAGAFVDISAVVIGDVEIGTDSSVWPLTVIRGDMHRIRIGARTSVQDGCVLHITHAGPFNPEGFPLLIGDDVTIAHKVMLHGCTVGSRVLIGMGSIVMDGAVVEDDVIIGAGSLVPPGKKLESGFLYVGSPVKQIRELTDKERAFFTYSAANYVKLKDLHLAQGFDQ